MYDNPCTVICRWPTRVFATDCLRKIIVVCEGDETHFDLEKAKELKATTGKGILIILINVKLFVHADLEMYDFDEGLEKLLLFFHIKQNSLVTYKHDKKSCLCLIYRASVVKWSIAHMDHNT